MGAQKHMTCYIEKNYRDGRRETAEIHPKNYQTAMRIVNDITYSNPDILYTNLLDKDRDVIYTF